MKGRQICDFVKMFVLFFVAVFAADAVTGARQGEGSLLGGSCRVSGDCGVSHARCSQGVCVCQPYYARVNDDSCLESVLLGSDCVVSEQCSLKVANSACLERACRCTEGFLQFRKHTCLGPAQPGQVCYSNEHCRLWDSDSHCEFVIPNLFGRCACDATFRHIGSKCVDQTPPTQNAVTELTSEEEEPSRNADKKSPNDTEAPDDDLVPPKRPTAATKQGATENSPLMQAVMKVPAVLPAKRIPLATRKDGEDTSRPDEMTASLHANDQPIYRVVTQPSADKGNGLEKPTGPGKPYKTEHKKKSSLKEKQRTETEAGPVSLGMSCLDDDQCKRGDPHSRCLNKRCDCAHRTNTTAACSARNRGCLPGTFQCRSTGNCISWYFVCDGRKDCPDGSDERCQGQGLEGDGERCPMHAFRCGGPGSACVSRAARCDGKKQCPGGEDERNCKATRRKGCPRHTFRCGSGECLPEYEFCNAVVSCKDGSDEPRHLCNEQSRWRAADFCPLRCGNGRCRSTAVACSGRDGCGDNSDEIACSVCKCPAPPQP